MTNWWDTVSPGDTVKSASWNSFTGAYPTGSTDNAIILADGTDGHKIKGSGKTIVTTLGSDDTTVPTSGAVKTVTDLKATTANKIDDFAVCGTSDTTKDANTTNHGLLLKAVAPATGFMRFIGIAYGETVYALKELFVAGTPAMDGAGTAGTALTAARSDHAHPVDTSRAPIDSPTFTTAASSVTPAVDDNDTSIATTAYVIAQMGRLLPAPATLNVRGLVTTLTAGETTAFPKVCYIKNDGKPWIASNAAAATAPVVCMATNTTGEYLFHGLVTYSSWTWNVGKPLYLSTAGGLTETPPTATTTIVQCVGWSITATMIYFNPSNTWIELT